MPPAPPPNLIIPPPIGPPLLPSAGSGEMLDFSKPPPGFGPLPPQSMPLPPLMAAAAAVAAAATTAKDSAKPAFPEIEMPYYNLPAGLMIPHIKVRGRKRITFLS